MQIEIFPKKFGRIAAQTAKQMIVQKIREAERNMVFTEYNDRKGEIVSGIIQKAEGGTVVLDLGKLEGIMPLKEQIPTETYSVNDKIKAYVVSVEKGLKGVPQVLVSRNHPDFVRKLFEFEIPEIYEGLIEVKSVARDAGNRSKVAVYSTNPDIDPVGSCVGQKGIRIQNIINELNGEKIDVIEWNEDIATFVSAALLPAQVMAVDVHEEEKFAQVIVPVNKNSIFYKIKDFFRNLFHIDTIDSEANSTESITEKENIKNIFIESIKDIEDEETKLLKLQKQYRRGQITENELTDEQVNSLCALYDKQITNLKKSNEMRKQKLLEYRKKLQTDE